MPPGVALIVTFRGSNYRFLEQIFMVPKGFEPSKFDCICICVNGFNVYISFNVIDIQNKIRILYWVPTTSVDFCKEIKKYINCFVEKHWLLR